MCNYDEKNLTHVTEIHVHVHASVHVVRLNKWMKYGTHVGLKLRIYMDISYENERTSYKKHVHVLYFFGRHEHKIKQEISNVKLMILSRKSIT